MATTKPDLTRVWANGAPPANVVDPDTTTPGKVLSGWQAEVPPFEHFNFLQKWFTQGLAHNNEEGINVWDTDTTYPVDALVKGSDGIIYLSIIEQNGNDPISDNGVNWKEFLGTYISGKTLSEAVSSTKAKLGQFVQILDRDKGIFEYVLASSYTPNTYDVIQSTGVPSLALRLVETGFNNVKELGAETGNPSNDVSLYINAGVSRFGKIRINNDGNDYTALSNIDIVDRMVVYGDGKYPRIVVPVNLGVDIFYQSEPCNNVLITGLELDASANFPVDSSVNKSTIPNNKLNYGILIDQQFKNVRIKDNRFIGFSHSSIRVRDVADSEGIFIEDNYFKDGNYVWKAVAIYSPNGSAENNRIRNANVLNNTFEGGGVQYIYDASDNAWASSSDCIHLDLCRDSKVIGNTLKGVGGVGIRVEETIDSIITENIIKGCGQEGITCYLNTFRCTVSNNIIREWGNAIRYNSYRSFGGSYYIAREFPDSTDAPLPADPSASDWFEEYPYEISNVDVGSIPVYSDTDYYDGTDGLLPFRGYAAISTTTGSSDNTVVGNTILGGTSTVGGKYIRAVDFGITPIHTVNSPAPSGDGNLFSGNSIQDTIKEFIWHPRYYDGINYTSTKLGLSYYGTNQYAYNNLSKVDIFNNLGGGVQTGNFTPQLTASSGSITLNSTNNKLNYHRVGNLVTITGKLRVDSVSTPTGTLNLDGLPFLIAVSDGESDLSIGKMRAFNFVTPIAGDCQVVCVASFSDEVILVDQSSGTDAPLADKVQAGSQMQINLSYMTGEF